jgi:hypothetical protein
MAIDSELVTLRGGLTVPLPALQVLWDLEHRGLDLQVEGADIVVRPRGVLTDADRAEIRRLKPDLIALIAYCAQPEARI